MTRNVKRTLAEDRCFATYGTVWMKAETLFVQLVSLYLTQATRVHPMYGIYIKQFGFLPKMEGHTCFNSQM